MILFADGTVSFFLPICFLTGFSLSVEKIRSVVNVRRPYIKQIEFFVYFDGVSVVLATESVDIASTEMGPL